MEGITEDVMVKVTERTESPMTILRGVWRDLGLGGPCSALSRSEQEWIALHLMGFYYWLCVQQLASAENVAEILDELAALFPESGALSMLHQCSMIGLAGGIEAVLARGQSGGDPTSLN